MESQRGTSSSNSRLLPLGRQAWSPQLGVWGFQGKGFHPSPFFPKQRLAFSPRKALDKDKSHFKEYQIITLPHNRPELGQSQRHLGEVLPVSREGRLKEAMSLAGVCLCEATLSLSVTPYIYMSGKVLHFN